MKEINPQPGKNVQWASSQDFTNGQALISTRHILHFSKGTLSKHLGKLCSGTWKCNGCLCVDETLKKVIVSNGLEKVMTQVSLTSSTASVEEDDDGEAVDDEES